jgi:hypothetical protein
MQVLSIDVGSEDNWHSRDETKAAVGSSSQVELSPDYLMLGWLRRPLSLASDASQRDICSMSLV